MEVVQKSGKYVTFCVKCKFPAKADNDAKVDSSLPVNTRKKKKKPPSARRRARRRQQRFMEKKAAEKATSPTHSVSQATIPKEPETGHFTGDKRSGKSRSICTGRI